MQKNTIEDLFDNLKGKFDVNEPKPGHELRFLDKMKTTTLVGTSIKKSKNFNWKPFLAIAASVILCISLFITVQNDYEQLDLASVSPEMSETQNFFTATIENELKKLNKERSPVTEQIISDALKQIELLQNEYKKLQSDLTENANDQRVIYAMISNFQNRIDILKTVLEQINITKELKTNTNQTSI